MKISVIIPVYNSENYLVDCIESILNQTYKNFEIVIVNDGSTDGSKKICTNYQKLYNNIKLFNIKNHGVSYARNFGIEKALGDYLYFMDSDDILFESCFEMFVNLNLSNNSLYCFNWLKYYKNTIPAFSLNKSTEKFINVEELILLNDNISSYLWNKFYFRSIIINNNIRFDENIHYCEDKIFNLNYIKYIDNIVYNSNVCYLYRIRKNSVSGQYICKKNLSIFNVCDFIISNSNSERVKDYYKWLYIINFKKFNIKYPLFEYDYEIINNRKKLYFSKNLSLKQKIKLFVIYNLYFIVKYIKKVENKNFFQ